MVEEWALNSSGTTQFFCISSVLIDYANTGNGTLQGTLPVNQQCYVFCEKIENNAHDNTNKCLG